MKVQARQSEDLGTIGDVCPLHTGSPGAPAQLHNSKQINNFEHMMIFRTDFDWDGKSQIVFETLKAENADPLISVSALCSQIFPFLGKLTHM